MEEIKKQEKTAYYAVEESFYRQADDGSEYLFTREVFFKQGSLLERRRDALLYAHNRSNEVELRVNEEEIPSVDEEKSMYRNLDDGWVPLPDELTGYKEVEIICSLVVEANGIFEKEIVIVHTDEELFFLIALSDEADFLCENV
jgi:hypothetical protein